MKVEQDVDIKAYILPLIIQPFVENAFVHGLEEKEKDGKKRKERVVTREKD